MRVRRYATVDNRLVTLQLTTVDVNDVVYAHNHEPEAIVGVTSFDEV